MKIKFIGTGSGITSINRFHSSLIFSEPKYKLLVDAGDGVSKALLSSNVTFKRLDGILISHLHPDHFSGIASLIVQMKLAERKSSLDVFIHKSLVDIVEKFLKQSYIFYSRLNFHINYLVFEHEEKIKITKDFSFTSKQNSHLDHYRIYDRDHTLSFSCSSFLFEYKNKNILYTGDIGGKDDIYLFGDRKVMIMISEISHISISDLPSIIQTIKAEKIILTHISDEDEIKLTAFFNSLPKNELKRISSAYDGLTINI